MVRMVRMEMGGEGEWGLLVGVLCLAVLVLMEAMGKGVEIEVQRQRRIWERG
jgi:hypothetical protein